MPSPHRLVTQIPSEAYLLVVRTVALKGPTVPEFVVAALQEEAQAVTSANGSIQLTSADQMAFAKSVDPSRSTYAGLWSYRGSELDDLRAVRFHAGLGGIGYCLCHEPNGVPQRIAERVMSSLRRVARSALPKQRIWNFRHTQG